jgi:hypothetical protein
MVTIRASRERVLARRQHQIDLQLEQRAQRLDNARRRSEAK